MLFVQWKKYLIQLCLDGLGKQSFHYQFLCLLQLRLHRLVRIVFIYNNINWYHLDPYLHLILFECNFTKIH